VENFLKKIDQILTVLVVTILAVMLGLTVLQVTLRYVFNSPTIWSEELTLFLLVWFGFIVMAMGVRDDSHIALEYFYDKQNRKGKMILDFLRHFLIFSLSILMIFYGVQMIKLGWANKMPATQIRRGYLYATSVAGGILMALFSGLHIFELIFRKPGVQHDS